MLDLEYWSNPSIKDKNFFAAFWTTKNIIVPIAEKEVFYKGWIYEIDDNEYNRLCNIRKKHGYNIDYCGKCKTIEDARQINMTFIDYHRILVKIIESGDIDGIANKIRHV